MVFIVGPILVTALATGIGPEAGLAAIVVCAVGGTLALAAQRSTQPEPSGRPASPARGGALRFPALRAIYLGLSAGAAVGGDTVRYLGAGHGYAVPTAFGLLALLVMLAGRRLIQAACLPAPGLAAAARPAADQPGPGR